MNYGFLADATAIFHAFILVALVIGLLICFRYKRFRPIEAGAFILIIWLWSYYGNCPLVILEQHLRELAGQDVNLTSIGFIPYYANKFWGYEIQSRVVQRTVFFTGGVLFAASIEWLAPFFHMELFRVRRTLRRLARN